MLVLAVIVEPVTAAGVVAPNVPFIEPPLEFKVVAVTTVPVIAAGVVAPIVVLLMVPPVTVGLVMVELACVTPVVVPLV
jgi:hypothetical protein